MFILLILVELLTKLFNVNLFQDAIAGALVAYGLLTKMSKRTEDIELKKYFTRNALYVDINVVSIQ